MMSETTEAGKLAIDPDEIGQLLEEKAAASKRVKQLHRVGRYIGAPLPFVRDVCLLTEGRAALVVALCIYRRIRVCNSRTITLPTAELAELDISRSLKREALTRLQSAGLIRVRNAVGQTAKITLTWQPSERTD